MKRVKRETRERGTEREKEKDKNRNKDSEKEKKYGKAIKEATEREKQ